MEIISSPISRLEFASRHCSCFDSMSKVVVDIEKGVIAVDAELHADLESMLIENGSQQENLWGANLYPSKPISDFIEYTSLINIRPHQNNFSMEVHSETVKQNIRRIVLSLIKYESETS